MFRAHPAPLVALLVGACLCAQGAMAASQARASPALPAPPLSATLLQRAQDVAIAALGLVGVDYRFGGETPASGVDCSGLVRYVFSQTTGIALPRTAAEMGRVGARVARIDLLPGDLVFFNTRHFVNSHVGIYLGDNRFVHAPSRGSEVTIASLDDAYWKKRFTGARRLIGVMPVAGVPAAPTLPAPPASALAVSLSRVDLTP